MKKLCLAQAGGASSRLRVQNPCHHGLERQNWCHSPLSAGAVEFICNILGGGRWVGMRQIGIDGGGRSVGGFGSVEGGSIDSILLPLQDL